jgi:alanine racemase
MPRKAVEGARVLINGVTFPVIGAVSASHTIIEVGDEQRVQIGDVATLLGHEHEDIHPNNVAAATDTSVYDRLMHLNPLLPKVVV